LPFTASFFIFFHSASGSRLLNGTLLRLVGMGRLLAIHALCFFLEAVQDALSAIEGNGTAKLLNAELVRAQ
jgi:hypothetical protein